MYKHIYMSLCFLFGIILTSNAQTFLRGKISDSKDHQPVVGALIYIADMRTGCTSDMSGNYNLKNLAKRQFLVQVKAIGYATISRIIDLSKDSTVDFQLNTASIEASEVVVTGSAFTTDNARSSVAVVPVDRKELQSVGANNITDAIAQVPGVAGISTGSAISKPVIRGLGYNRIVTVNEGLRQEGQQWGDEHGLEIDQFSADRVEVLKGPSSLLYGSDALGGVINILEPIPAPLGSMRAEVNTQYATNNGLTANSLMLEGNQNGFSWRARASYKNAAAYKSPDETIYNSGFNERDANVMLGLNKHWGFSHLHFSLYDANIGLVEGERDSASGRFINADGEIISNDDAYTRKLDLPNQNIQHLKLSSVNSFFIGKSNLRITAGWQRNDRREFEESSTVPGLFFQLNTLSADVKYYLAEYKGIETVIGASTLRQDNSNKGNEFLIPAYVMQDAGAFVSLKKNFKSVTANAGVRYDYRNVHGDQLKENENILFDDFNSSFTAVSGSVGATWEINKMFNLKANVGRGFRAPNISELSANGVHEGTFRYEIGNHDLNPETSLQFDFGFGFESDHFSADLSAYYNVIDDFIYYRNFNTETINIDGSEFPVYRYVQGNSALKGFEASFDVHPFDQLHFENSVAYVTADNNETNTPLPFIPPLHYRSEVSYAIQAAKTKSFRDMHIKLMLDVYSKQDRIDDFETETAGAVVLGVSAGTSFKVAKQWADFFVLCTNLGDRNYYDHLSRLKDEGIHAMGRNITCGLTIPFGIK